MKSRLGSTFRENTVHKYLVELRISGKNLSTSEVTAGMGLEPSVSRREGETVGNKRYQYSLWAYNGRPADDAPPTWDTLESGLTFLLDRISASKEVLEQYQSKYNVIFWCGHFQSGFDGGPSLSPSLLKRLGEFGVGIFIDNYFSEDEEE
ncbi:MAG: DUF4279 domain-containing protein [Pyrinomonadaceae bacterium]